MRIKATYFQKAVEPVLFEDISTALKPFPEFREELFDKLHAFFSRYFSRSGSICFAYTPQHMSVYERVYTDEQDVVLFWKTHMLHYVKTDRLFNDLNVELDGHSFFFDCSGMELKKSNEKRELVYTFEKVEKKKDAQTARLTVAYSQSGRKTKTDDILKALHKAGMKVTEATLDKAMRIFGRQSEVDYFINKDAGGFLREQFDLWMYQYVFKDETHWTEGRIKQLQALKEIAYKLITFIAQFEDELLRVWTKPKFVRDSHYVITLDRIIGRDGGMEALSAFLKHAGIKSQVAEWKSLGIVNDTFDKKVILEGKGKDVTLADAWRSLPLDTRHFDKDLEISLLGLFDDLDNQLDGRLIKSENWQALNTFRSKYQKRIKSIYIDPPYNTGQDDFIYDDAIQASSWLSMLRERIEISKNLLREDAAFGASIDQNEITNCLQVLDIVFGKENRSGIATVKRGSVTGHKAINPGLVNVVEYLPIYANKKKDWNPNRLFKPRPRNDRYNSFIKNRSAKCETWEFTSLLDAFAAHLRVAKPQLKKELGGSFEKEIFKFVCDNRDAVIQFARPDADKVSEDVREAIKRSKINPSKVLHFARKNESDFYLRNGERIIFYADRLKLIGGKWVTVEPMADIWDDVSPNDLHNEGGVELKKGKKPESLLHRFVELTSNKGDTIADFFLGSGTLAAVAQKSGRRWFGTEFGDHFESKIIVRLKKVLAGESSGVSSACEWKGGGFFKYSTLEQYEDSISRACYAEEEDLFRNTKTDTYSQYVFFRDLKLVEGLEIDKKTKKVEVHLDRLYPDIDLAETLSCVTGKWIKRITADEVEFADGSKESLTDPDWRLIKPFIFWGPVV
ncbi:MAG: site-specific DNA-methyltransferase [Luteolibacter sp.]|nr:site-specific DNA-methyltransferase [Luteolibacter sp.]